MLIIHLYPLVRSGKEFIAIQFEYNKTLNDLVKKLPGIKWSPEQGAWYLPLKKESYQGMLSTIGSKAIIDDAELKHYLETIRHPSPVPGSALDPAGAKTDADALSVKLGKENHSALVRFTEQLKLRAYSKSTIRTYRNEFLQLLKLLKHRRADTLTPDDIKRYMVYAMEKEGISENTAHSRLNALKFYYEQVLKKEKFFWEIPRPKKPLLLPKLLNEDELRKLFRALSNLKHKAMLFTAYAAGLRVSEIVNLKITDIDSNRMQIFVERSKGKKDRYVNLSPLLLDILRKYIANYKPRPVLYLFESEQTGKSYPVRTVQQIFSNARSKAGIKKEVGIHSLRHSFATHLLDKGTDIHYIKELLGHFDIRTTERYLHVSKKSLVNITSPLDELMKNGKIDW